MYICMWPPTVKIQNCSITTEKLTVLPLSSCLHLPHHCPYPLAISNLSSISIILSFQGYYVNEMVQYVSLWDWMLFFLSIMSLKYIQVVMCIINWFLFITEQHFIIWMYQHLLNYLSVEGNQGCFQFWAIQNKAAKNLSVQVFVQT